MTTFTYFMPTTQFRRVGNWLKSLDADTLRSYFGFSLNQNGIDHLVTKWKINTANHYFLIAHRADQWVGILHIATFNDEVEFGVIVKQEFRRQGIADQLLNEAITWAQNRGYQKLFMHCVVENQVIQRLCEKHQLTICNTYGDIVGEMKLPKANWRSMLQESIQRQANWYYFVRECLN